MEENIVKRISFVGQELSKLVTEINPQGAAEWEAFDHLCGAYRHLRRIATDKLGQLSLLTPEGAAEPPQEQIPLPETAAVQHAEDSLAEFDRLPEAPPAETPKKRRSKHA